jgi:hypothetical protein
VLLIAGSNPTPISAKTTNFDWVSEFVICLWHEVSIRKKIANSWAQVSNWV